MLSKKEYKNFFTLLILFATTCVTIATSTPHMSFVSGSFYIISDCIAGNLESTVDVSNYQIINPSGMSFLDFGFPVATITPDNEMIGPIGSVTRVCKKTFGGDSANDEDMIFTCYDNNQYACSILIQKP